MHKVALRDQLATCGVFDHALDEKDESLLQFIVPDERVEVVDPGNGLVGGVDVFKALWLGTLILLISLAFADNESFLRNVYETALLHLDGVLFVSRAADPVCRLLVQLINLLAVVNRRLDVQLFMEFLSPREVGDEFDAAVLVSRVSF